MKTFRVASINISNDPNGLSDRYSDLAHALKTLKTDFLLMQEVTEPELLEKVLQVIGFRHVTLGASTGDRHKNDRLLIASIEPHSLLQETRSFGNHRSGLYVTSKVGRHRLVLATSHFAWGSDAEGIRLRQAEEVNHNAMKLVNDGKDPADIIIFGGDLNSDEESKTVRYLHGFDLAEDGVSSTYWTDAFASGRGSAEDWATTDQGGNEIGKATAKRFGIDYPEFLPQRRIDYLLSYGWRYGKPGGAVAFGTFAKNVSDHHGIWADFIAE